MIPPGAKLISETEEVRIGDDSVTTECTRLYKLNVEQPSYSYWHTFGAGLVIGSLLMLAAISVLERTAK